MAYEQGLAVQVYVNTGTLGVPVYTVLGAEQDASLNLSLSTAETTNKSSANWRELIVEDRSWNVSLAATHVTADAASRRLISDWMSRAVTMIQLKTWDGYTYSGTTICTSLSGSFPRADVIKMSFTLEGSGVLTQA